MILDLFKLSFQNLTRRKLRSYLTMIGIFIGIAAVVSLIGLGEGLRMAITNQFGFLGTDVLSIQADEMGMAGPPGTAASNPLKDDIVDKIEKVPGVDFAINRHIRTGTVKFKGQQSIGMMMSMPGGDNRRAVEKMVNLKIEKGRMLKDGDVRKVVVGYNLENPEKDETWITVGDNILINDLKYNVVGILEKKGSFMFDNIIAINTETLLEDFGDKGTTNIIAVKVEDEKEIMQVKERIEKVMRKERDVKLGEEDFSVSSPQQALESLNSTLFAVQLFVTIIAAISLVVGGIGIMNTMYTAVLERTKEIGILKSIGATNRAIFGLFFFESGLLGMVGGLIGVIIGLGLAYGMAFAGKMALNSDLIQAHVSPFLILGALSFSFFIGIIAGVIPATKAAKKHPVDALRYSK